LLNFIKTHHNPSSMQNNPAVILEAMDEFASQHDFLINIGNDKGRTVADIIAKHKPKIAVELGGYVGYSAILFAAQMRQVASDPDKVHLWSLEYDASFAAIATELIALAELQDLVTVVVGSADESLRKLKADGKVSSIDFLFLDHVEDLYEQDFRVAMDELGLLKTGAVIFADNVVRPGAPKYREHVRGRTDLRSEGVKGLIMPGEFDVGLIFDRDI
jgi:catechol O-methyltransferase